MTDCVHGPHLTRESRTTVRCQKCGKTFHVSLSRSRKLGPPYRAKAATDAGKKKYGPYNGQRKGRLPGQYRMEHTTTKDPFPKKKSRDIWTLDMFDVA